MAKQVKSSQAMQQLQPKIKALQEKYSSKDQNTQKKLQEEQMKLFRSIASILWRAAYRS
ncbi:inner membrane protein translocase component YidC, short form OxaI-like [Sporolactobacillus inulinus]|uniref:Inner membrane protein translocase component YidC, short form OxaI-like n=1 Tax=Sporolactobacillus inulinus TaxID=2078 RepID=A0A4Y1ZDN8_9BACL|nr:inner membrane protein translocase component YidC, short form OxaI-like [Sporolactobacillus inulinus]